ncbi:MAG: UDP-N-acetylglucosamine 2-epimerase (non-hydrolyzing) [Calditrichaeota bacterium]|nr:MAG: UDP-N-acetylglucosamine 2-epimerase (non-hydrolyzing) [Calditrichota bacterium]
MRKKIATIVGARPQFIKCAPVSELLRKQFREVLIHTGQHYNPEMSHIFFQQLQIPEPDYNLEVGSHPHGRQTGFMLMRIEAVLLQEKPALVLVYGDTNSTLAGALAAAKLNVPVAHVEAGLRSFNRKMPEEINRIVADRLASLLFCPTRTAVKNLKAEGQLQGVYWTGDVMYDALLRHLPLAEQHSRILDRLGLSPKAYYLATVHRAENTDQPERLNEILKAFARLPLPVVFPVHPRTRRFIQTHFGERNWPNIRFIDPVSYLDVLVLQKNAAKVLTDSGGMQKEAYFLEVPCVTLREETEWPETVAAGANVLTGASAEKILAAATREVRVRCQGTDFGDGQAAARIVALIDKMLEKE